MRVLFIILNYQTYNDTLVLAHDIISHKTSDDGVLIVDNDSPNGSFQILNQSLKDAQDVSIIKTDSNCGFARGNNFGLRYAKKLAPKYVCIINNDIRFDYSTIDYLCEIFPQIPDAGIISPIQTDINNQIVKFWSLAIPTFWTDIREYQLFFKKPLEYHNNYTIPNVEQVGIIPGAFMFTDYELFASIDFFNEETFLYCEERFVAQKLLTINRKNYIIINKTYRHEHSKTIDTEYNKNRQNKMILEGRLLYAKKYYPLPTLSCAIIKVMYAYRRICNTLIHLIKILIKH